MAFRAKVVLFFQSDNQGWTETYYWESATLGFDSLTSDLALLRTARRQLLGTDCTLFAYRITDMTILVDPVTGTRLSGLPSVLDHLTAPGAVAGSGPGISGPPWSAFLVNLYSAASVYRRSLLLRGLPAEWDLWNSANPVTPAIPGPMRTALDNFASVLAGPYVGAPPIRATTRWCLLGRSKDLNAAPKWDIYDVAVVSSTDKHYLITIPATQTFRAGDIVHVSKVRACTARGINGDSVVIKVAASLIPFMQELTISKTQCCAGPIAYKGGGKLNKVLKTVFSPIVQVIYCRTVNRKSGRPFAGTRGRQGAGCCG